MNKIKKLFSPQAGDTYHSHQAGVPDGVYHRSSVDNTAGVGSSSTEDKTTSGAQPSTSPYASTQQTFSATGGSSYGESARRVYSGTSQTSGPAQRTRNTSTASKPTSPTKYTTPTNFAYGGPLYQSKSSTTDPTPATTGHETSSYDIASPANDAMTSNSSSQLPPGAFVDDTPNSARSATGAAGPSRGTTGAPQIGRQDLGESLDAYSTGTTSRSGTTGTGYDGSAAAAGTGLNGATLADRSVSGGNTSGRPGADYKGTDNFTPHPHDVDASNKPLAAPEDNDAVRTSEPATTIAARVMGAGGGETTSYAGETTSYASSGRPGIASTTSGNTAMPSSNTSSSGNYGRDAAVGGAGLGAGATGATMISGRTGDGLDPSDSGPASGTVGPHSSNVANIMDPRVKPDPSKMHGSDPAATTGGSSAGAGAFPAGTATSSQPATVGGPGETGLTGSADHNAYAHGRHPDAAPYSTERHVERDLYESEQTKGGPLGFVHKHQESKYADKDEPNTTARDKYYGGDGATHPIGGTGSGTAFDEGGHHGTSGHGGQSIGGGAGHRAYDDAGTGTGTTSHDYGTGKSGTRDSSQASPADSGRTSLDSEGRPKKRGLMDKILHREAPNKLHKEPPS